MYQVALDVLAEKSKIMNIKNDLVFSSSVCKKIDRHNLRRAFNIATKKAGVDDFHFHDLRYTFATRVAQKGIDIYKISKLLGHHDIRMTQRYSHHCSVRWRDGIQILEVDYNLTTVGEKRDVSNV